MTLTEVRDFLIGAGWRYIGTCGCSTNMYKYNHPTNIGYEMRVGVKADRFEIRHQGRTIRQGTTETFNQIYGSVFTG